MKAQQLSWKRALWLKRARVLLRVPQAETTL
jgi:hypothetical protein